MGQHFKKAVAEAWNYFLFYVIGKIIIMSTHLLLGVCILITVQVIRVCPYPIQVFMDRKRHYIA